MTHPNPYAPKVLEAFRALKEAARTVDVLLELSPKQHTVQVLKYKNGKLPPEAAFAQIVLTQDAAQNTPNRPGKLPHKPWPHTHGDPTPRATHYESPRAGPGYMHDFVKGYGEDKKYTDGAYHWLRVPVTEGVPHSEWIIGKYGAERWQVSGIGLWATNELITVGPRIHMPPEDDWNE